MSKKINKIDKIDLKLNRKKEAIQWKIKTQNLKLNSLNYLQ